MYFFCLLVFYQTTSALIYDDKCTTQCNFPGMVCSNGRCKCDEKSRLFWTGARCAPCPNDWSMFETACLTYYETSMSWIAAEATCRNVKAELISFRNRNIISLLYKITANKGRKKRIPRVINQLGAWTSAHAVNLSGLGVYRWLDKSMKTFDINNEWWCRSNTPHLGYAYPYNEPTRYNRSNGETEACAVYWRGSTSTEIVCLDDQLCSHTFPFVCEKSESTAKQYLGAPPTGNNLPGIVGPLINNGSNTTPKPKKKPTVIVIIGIIAVLLLLALLAGIFCFLKRRNANRAKFNVGRYSKETSRVSKISGTSANDTVMKDEPIHVYKNPTEGDLTLLGNIIPKPVGGDIGAQKNKRGGYNKQQFDEFG